MAGAVGAAVVTPLGDAIPPQARAGIVLGCALTAMVLGLWQTAVAAWTETSTVRAGIGPAVLPLVGSLTALIGGSAVWWLHGGLRLVALAGFAVAVHLVASSLLRAVTARVPGADPRAAAAAGPSRRVGVRQVMSFAAWLPLVTLALAAAGGLGWAWRAGFSTPDRALADGVAVATAVLLGVSPSTFLLARALPVGAARDRGRELGLYYGAVDLDEAAAVRALLLDPIGVATDPEPRLVGVRTVGRLQVTAALQAAASVAVGSDVPEHRTLVASAAGRALSLRPTELLADDASGTRVARIKGTEVTIGPATAFERVPVPLITDDTALFVGWGGIARAGFEFVPSVRSEALEPWPLVRGYGLRPLFRSADPARLRHVGAAMEVPPSQTFTDDAQALAAAHEHGPALVLAQGCTDGLAPEAAVVVREGAPNLPDTPASEIRCDRLDLQRGVRVVGLARKARRVTTQSLALAGLFTLVPLLAALTGHLDPFVAAVVGAASPVLVAANSLRPRSYAR